MTDANNHRKRTTMRRSTLAIIIIALIVFVPFIAIIAADNAQYSSAPITIKHGIAYAETANNGIQSLDTIYENDLTIPDHKITGYKAPKTNDNKTPATLPNTSAAHGDHTCDMGTFQVTTDEPCENLK